MRSRPIGQPPSRNDLCADPLIFRLGQTLMHRGIIQHVCNSEPFADHYFFYRFATVRH